ncbi:MAG: isoprenylcysteine carboxylmethyltransferase family protein [Propionibacteriaceae bacterium]|nr:isoprenylcysteine carboxylmethyltransferase family protein [Propionibacteriaceae bacterium]
MGIQAWIVVGAFVCLIALVISRVILLKKRGIQAFLFGATHKSDAILPVVILGVGYCLIAPVVGWPIWSPLVSRFWATTLPGWIGVALCVLAVMGMAWTLVSFGDSFRVGIDDQRPAGLVTSGAFAHSRNPIYVCFFLFVLGVFLVVCNLILVLVLIGFSAIIHRQVIREEGFLAGHYGQEFETYRTTVRRYL